MKRRTNIFAVLLGLTSVSAAAWCVACGGSVSDPQPDFPQEITDEEIDEAVVRPEDVQATYDEDATNDGGIGGEGEGEGTELTVRSGGLVGEQSRLVGNLRDGIAVSNGMLLPALKLINDIKNDKSKEVFRDRRLVRWEVRDDGAVITLVVSRDPDFKGQWNYALSVRAERQPVALARTLLTGFYRPGPLLRSGLRVGEGVIRYDYTATSRFEPQGPTGVGAVGFRVNPDGGKQLTVLFVSFQEAPGSEPINARYDYDLNGDGSGFFQFRLRADLFDDSPGLENYRQTVVWNDAVEGRGKLFINGDAFPTGVTLEECWDVRQQQVWSHWSPLIDNEVNDGDESACAPDFVGIDLPIPEAAEVPADEDPKIPESG